MADDPVGISANHATVGKHLVALTWDSALCKDSGVLRGMRIVTAVVKPINRFEH